MPDSGDQADTGREAIALACRARWTSGLLGLAGVGSGGVAVFLTRVEAGPVALIAGGVLFLFMALGGVLPTSLKIGQTEAQFQKIKETVVRIDQEVPEIGALLDAGGVSLKALVSGNVPDPNPDLVQAGLKVGSLAKDVNLVETQAGLDAVPAKALLEMGRWFAAQREWADAARYFDEFVKRGEGTWEDYFALGVCQMNTRGAEKTDREALRAYDEAIALLPADPPMDLTARLYSYRAAAKKRLRRLREAKVDAEIAKQLAVSPYERIDATYNLAGIEAMLGNRDAAIAQIAELNQLGAADLVLAHLDDYFQSLRDDEEFQRIVRLPAVRRT